MADFTALKTYIQNYVYENHSGYITGDDLQDVLIEIVEKLGDEAINAVASALSTETTNRQNADGAEATARQNADTALQNLINGIKANIDNGYVYAGIATPTGTPVTGKVFYIATAAGTYTNFGGLVLTQGINILKYNGSAWSSEQVIGIDDYPTSGSSKLPRSGGVDAEIKSLVGYYTCGTAAATAAKTITASNYILLQGGSIKVKFTYKNTVADATLKIGNADAKPLYYAGRRAGSSNSWEAGEVVEIFYDGTNYMANNVMGGGIGEGVFDISVYNADNGVPHPYVDLDAALSGTNVPPSVRRGGMSVKFIQGSVQSSDNKYVQYRLMSNSFNTTPANWQGVDEEPTAGSENLVESGSVKEGFTTIGSEADIIINETISSQQKEYTRTVHNGETFYFRLTGTYTSIAVSFRKSGLSYQTTYKNQTFNGKFWSFTADDDYTGIHFFIVGYSTPLAIKGYTTFVRPKIEDIENQLNNVPSEIDSWINEDKNWTDVQKAQGRENLGFGDGDIDTSIIAGSKNVVENNAIYNRLVKVGTDDDILLSQSISEVSTVVEFEFKKGSDYLIELKGTYGSAAINFRKNDVYYQEVYLNSSRKSIIVNCSDDYSAIKVYMVGDYNSLQLNIYNSFTKQEFDKLNGNIDAINATISDNDIKTNKLLLKNIGISASTLPWNYREYFDVIKEIHFLAGDIYLTHEYRLTACSAYDAGTTLTTYQIWILDKTDNTLAAKYEANISDVDLSTPQTITATGDRGILQAVIDFNALKNLNRALIWADLGLVVDKFNVKSIESGNYNYNKEGYAFYDSDILPFIEQKGLKPLSGTSVARLRKYNSVIKAFQLIPSAFAADHTFVINVLSANHASDNTYRLWVYDSTAAVSVGSVNIDPSTVQEKNNVLCKSVNDYCSWYAIVDFQKMTQIGDISWGNNEVEIVKTNQDDPQFADLLSVAGKSIWWCGTSIPEAGYPQVVGKLLNCNVYNVAKGSSIIRRGSTTVTEQDPIGLTNCSWQAIGFSLSQTLADKEDIIENWDTYKTMMTDNPPATLTDAQKELFRNCSYERKLIPYLDGTYPLPDLFVIDHGHNDILLSTFDTQMPQDVFDKQTFIGAENFIINTILSYHPHARIIIMGDYENTLAIRDGKVAKAQETIAHYWGLPLIRAWSMVEFSPAASIWTDGYWDSNNVWHDHGYEGGYRWQTMNQVWMADGIHPTQAIPKNYLARLYAKQIKLLW